MLEPPSVGVVHLKELPEGFHQRPPDYVRMGGLALRHQGGGSKGGSFGEYSVPNVYYRDAGAWGVEYEWREDGLFSVSDMEQLNGNSLTEISKEEWKEDNGRWA